MPGPTKGEKARAPVDEAALVGGIGRAIRRAREAADLSQRELARRAGCTGSLISQIESGRSMPSVSTLYAIANELGLAIDDVFRDLNGTSSRSEEESQAEAGAAPEGPVVQPSQRRVLVLETGVRWERMASLDRGTDFLFVVYEPGGSSSPGSELIRHQGCEYGLVMEGRLWAQVGFETYEVGPGDAISFDSTTPHRYWNEGPEPVRGVWFVTGQGPAGL